MRVNVCLKTLTVAIAACSTVTAANAAGLDRSGQDITAFLQDGLYAEAVYTYIQGDVSGRDNAYVGANNDTYQEGRKIDDIAESYDYLRYGVKADLDDTFSVGVLYDEPFGANADYTGNNDFVGAPTEAVNNVIASQLGDRGVTDVQGLRGLVTRTQTQLATAETGLNAAKTQLARAQGALQQNPALEPQLRPVINQLTTGITTGEQQLAAGKAQLGQIQGLQSFADGSLANKEGTRVKVRTENITGILGAKFGTHKEFQVYGGPVLQRIQANVSLRGDAYGPATGYTANLSPDQNVGWIAGASYSKPDIALKAALTYRSEIDHTLDISETYPLVAALGSNPVKSDKIDITTPKSVNFDFQTGLNPTTLATAKVRWVPWSDFSIEPPLYNTVSKRVTNDDKGLPLVSYDDDQWMVELGLAKRLSPALAITGNVGWDSGAGDPITSLGPIEGYYSAGLGAKYNLTKNWAVSAGGKYLWFGDAKGKLPTQKIVSNFEDNDGYAIGVKLSYQAKQDFN